MSISSLYAVELAASLARPVVRPSELAHGLHRGFDADDYHFRELGMVSKGALDLVRRSPAHYLSWVSGDDERPDTKPFAFGTALHMRCLEPGRFDRTYLVAPEFGPQRKTDACSSEQAKENKSRRAAWMAAHAGATILDAATGMATLAMIDAIADHPIARPLLESGDPELTVRWRCPTSGLECKARADRYRADIRTVVDVKSAADASPDAFRRSVANFGYHRIEGHYRDGFGVLGEPLDHHLFLVVEKEPPFAIAIYSLDEEFRRLGERQVARARVTLADCLATSRWPAYPDRIETLSLPRWMKDENE